MSDLEVPIIAIIIGEGGSGGALALALGDKVWMMEHAIYAILSPEGFASILWKDGSRANEASELMKITAKELKELGIIDKVIPEVMQERDLTHQEIIAQVRIELVYTLKQLCQLSVDELRKRRYQRFRKY